MTTVNTNKDQSACLFYEDENSDAWWPKSLIRFPLPASVRGKVPTAATLYLYQNNANSNTLSNVMLSSCVQEWEEGDGFSVLNGLSLSELSSVDIEDSVGWKSFNVLGDSFKGVKEACMSSRLFITLAITVPAYDAPEEASTNYDIYIGSESGGVLETVRIFDGTGVNIPYLAIEVEDDEELPTFAMCAGVVV